jgi:histone H3/H4
MTGTVVVSKVKDIIKNADMNCASDFPDALDKEIEELVKKAIARAKSNDRKTVRPGDL